MGKCANFGCGNYTSMPGICNTCAYKQSQKIIHQNILKRNKEEQAQAKKSAAQRKAQKQRDKAAADARRAARKKSSSNQSSGSFGNTPSKSKPRPSFFFGGTKAPDKEESKSSSNGFGAIVVILAIFWVIGNFVSEDSQSASRSSYVSSVAGTNATVKYPSGLNLREGPGLAYDKVYLGSGTRAIPNGHRVTILEYAKSSDVVYGRKGKWCKVKYKGRTGWAWGWGITRD